MSIHLWPFEFKFKYSNPNECHSDIWEKHNFIVLNVRNVLCSVISNHQNLASFLDEREINSAISGTERRYSFESSHIYAYRNFAIQRIRAVAGYNKFYQSILS